MTATVYINDAAILVLALCGSTLFIAACRAARLSGPGALTDLAALRRSLRSPVIASVVIVTVSAVPRLFLFARFEFARAAEGLAMPGLIARHLVALLLLVAGIALWNGGSRRLNRLSDAGPAAKA